ncbi:hypothetical protein RZN22_15825 [Bacillaceae bacterium S4-13-58]
MKDPSSDFDIEQLVNQTAEEINLFIYTYVKNPAIFEELPKRYF